MKMKTFDEVLAIGINLGVVGVMVGEEFRTTDADGSFSEPKIFCYLARDSDLKPKTVSFKSRSLKRERPSVSDSNSFNPDQFFVLALWSDGGWGRNSTGEGKEGAVTPTAERDLIVIIARLLDQLGIRFLDVRESLLKDFAIGNIRKVIGRYSYDIDTPISEAHYHYAYEAVNLNILHNWVINCGKGFPS